MERVESAAADTTRGNFPTSFSIPSNPALKELYSSDPVPRSNSTLPLAETRLDASGGTYHSIMHSSGKLVPIGIAHPVRKYSEEALESNELSSPVELKKASHSRLLASEEYVSRTEESGSPASSHCSSSCLEELTTPPSLRQTVAVPSRSESVMSMTEDDASGRSGTSSGLPCGKRLHVFVSHSTSDQGRVKRCLVAPLESESLTVSASYRFMPDVSRYDDAQIHATIRGSSVVVVGLSPAYVTSTRCRCEWELANKLAGSKECQVIVAAIATCSRPQPLKRFLYLDFISEDKRERVWDKFLEAIYETIDQLKLTNRQRPESDLRPRRCPQRERSLPLVAPAGSSEEMVPDLETYQEQLDASLQMGLASAFEADLQNWKEEQGTPESGSECWRGGGGEAIQSLAKGSPGEDDKAESDDQEEKAAEQQRQSLKRGVGPLDKSDAESGEVVSEEDDEKLERKKLKVDEVEEGELSSDNGGEKQQESQSAKVADFYDKLAQPDADKRKESPILQLRGFNNWVKSILIRSVLPPAATVLDLCCGKGGDLLKWKEGGIEYLVCADISSVCVDQCKDRYQSRKMSNAQTGKPPFTAEFIVADCCEVRLRDRYENEARRFHVASCQFSLHYAFETYEKAKMMLTNACENLRRDGYFIGTTVDAYELIHRLRHFNQRNEKGEWYIGNDVFSVKLDSQFNPHRRLPLFGAKYLFKLHGVVNLPEFVIYFPLLERMLNQLGMELVLKQNLYDFFSEHRTNPEDAHLLYRMNAFSKRTGSMSAAEWEVAGLYLVFVFQKKR